MKFIAGGLNGVYLQEIAEHAISKTQHVQLAVSYASNDPILFRICIENNIKVEFWCRYDQSIPVSLPILKKFLDKKSPNFVCKLVPDIFHSKVIWWHEFGLYIGSANLTDRGWYNNIEAGVFIEESEIIGTTLTDEILQFFSDINFKSFPLTNEIYEELCIFYEKNKEIRKNKEKIRNEFQITRKLPKLEPLTYVSQKRESDKHKEHFLKEWYDTLQNLRDIGDRVATDQFRPKWINSTTPKGVQADQFLHAFYYSQVKEGTRARHWEFFEKNKGNIEIALVDAMEWWASLESPPHSEDITINKWSIFLREKLQKDSLISISKEQFVEVCSYVHAMRDHSLRVSYKSYGLSEPLPQMELEDRIKYLAKWLFDRKSIEGKSVIDTLNYVLYGGEKDQIPERLWEATNSPKWRIPHLGISSIGEIIGWALPNDFPPRNGRTSKALTSLGYNVVIHSE